MHMDVIHTTFFEQEGVIRPEPRMQQSFDPLFRPFFSPQ